MGIWDDGSVSTWEESEPFFLNTSRLDLIRILQSSLDPVFCSELCIVEISICVCLDVVIPGEFARNSLILENEFEQYFVLRAHIFTP